jgi:Xaa-Pro aminopeptidase
VRHAPIDPHLFRLNRDRLRPLLPPGSLVIVNANDIPPTNADGTLRPVPNSDLFYLTGIEQEESILVLFPDAEDPLQRELLFLRETDETIARWEGHKLTQAEATHISGITRVHWTRDFPRLFHRLMCEADTVWLNSNEHRRSDIVVESRDARFVRWAQEQFPLHRYERLSRLMHRLRPVKSPEEIRLMREACAITRAGFERVCHHVCPGISELDLEAEFAHEFTRRHARFAYSPIIAAGANACVLHYLDNDQPCRNGDLLLLDVGAAYANYAADLTRTIPVNGRFNRRQRRVYDAVLRVVRGATAALQPGKKWRQWQDEAEELMTRECVDLGLLKPRDLKRKVTDPSRKPVKRFFMHGIGHPLGLDVHDVAPANEAFAPGWVLTVEPGIYLPDEGLAVRLENNVLITESGVDDLMADIPIEAEAIETLMNQRRR